MTDETQGQWTRRDFLTRLGRTAGSASMYHAMTALGLIAVPPAYAGPPRLPAGSGQGKSVVIIGAGIGGLTAAHELTKAGYACTLLEASARAGGRNRTARRGDQLLEIDSEQVCDFDDEPHLYFNCGPARLPYHHEAVLGYCREFGVALEPFVNDNRGAYFHSTKAFQGKPVRSSTIMADTRGLISEMLAKAVHGKALDQPLSTEDGERLLGLLRAYGDLDDQRVYKGSRRRGQLGDEILAPGQPQPPIGLSELLKSDFWQAPMVFTELWEQQPTMMQPVGGMDMIVKGFERSLGDIIKRKAPVTRIVNGEQRVKVIYRDGESGREQEIEADFCINNAPAWIVSGMRTNLSARYREALASIHAGKLFKIAFQGKRRFWEEDDQIYGGISWTDQDILQLWYPPHGFHQKKGVILGAYQFDPKKGEQWGRMQPAERLAAAIAQGEKIHPGYGKMVEKGLSVAWHKVPYQLGCAPEWTEDARAQYFPVLREPEGRHYLVGDQMSYVTGWQEGAVRSAQVVVEHIHQRVAAHA